MFAITHQKLFGLLNSGVLKTGNRDRCTRLFYDIAKIIHYRQTRLNKPQLKMTEFTSALALIDFYHSCMFRFEARGPLACNFGGEFAEDEAVEYFEHSVLGTVHDAFGRKIAIEDSGLLSLYKEAFTGKHVIAPENYEAVRGKRLPWIRYVLEKSKSIYRVDENVRGKFRRTYLYTGLATIPLREGQDVSYFIVVVLEENGNLRFLTAFHIQNHNRFLSRIEQGVPVSSK